MIALIVARGGSKRLPGKNIKLFNGLPLICWTISAAQKSELFDHIIVSTDNAEIAKISEAYGATVPFLRPAVLASDKAEMLDVVLHATDFLNFSGKIALLQPTSPLRNERHILEAFELMNNSGRKVVSFTKVAQSLDWLYYQEPKSPHLRLVKDDQGSPSIPFDRVSKTVLIPNGAIYMLEAINLRTSGKFIDNQTEPYLMDREDSIDIDTQSDWDFADIVFKGKTKNG